MKVLESERGECLCLSVRCLSVLFVVNSKRGEALMQTENIVMSKTEIGFIGNLCYWKCLWCQEYRVKKKCKLRQKVQLGIEEVK